MCTAAIAVPDITETSDVPQRPTPMLLTDQKSLCEWIAHAVPGAVITYYRGHLAHDRMPSSRVFAESDRRRLVAVAKRALLAAEDGLIHLVQRRHGPHDYSYMAVKARSRLSGRVVPLAARAGR